MIDANSMPQSVLVFGGGSEIASEVLQILAERRLETVVLCGPGFESMERVRSKIQTVSSAKVDLVHFDIAQVHEVAKATDHIFSEYGPIDCVILAAGVLGDQLRDEESPEEVIKVTNVNYVGPAALLTAVRNQLLSQGYGQIVVLSSVAGERVRRSNYIYGASKAALDGFALALGESLADKGIYTLVVRPGFVKTKMTEGLKAAPLSQTPKQVASQIVKAMEQQRTLIWSPPAIRYVMSLYRHLPRAIASKIPM